MNALKKGKISSERIEESYKRIIDIKNKYRLSEFKIENNEFDIAYKQIASDISRKSIKIVKGKPVNLKNNKIKMIFFVPQRFSKESLIIYEKMKRNGLDVDFTLLSSDKINSVEILNNSNFDTLIIANYSWPKMSEKRFKNIIKISQKFNKKIFINFLNPVDSQKINNYFDSIIETYGINEYSANAVANELREAGGEK
jgi:beta-glucosidase-like glycosyl hydrolase